jgi:hypothetical protein
VVLITSGAVVTGGVAEIGNGTVFIAASSSENVSFLANGSGGLVLNGLGNAYAGRVSGFGVGSSAHSDHDHFIDFDAVNFAGATFTYTSANPSNTSGTLPSPMAAIRRACFSSATTVQGISRTPTTAVATSRSRIQWRPLRRRHP